MTIFPDKFVRNFWNLNNLKTWYLINYYYIIIIINTSLKKLRLGSHRGKRYLWCDIWWWHENTIETYVPFTPKINLDLNYSFQLGVILKLVRSIDRFFNSIVWTSMFHTRLMCKFQNLTAHPNVNFLLILLFGRKCNRIKMCLT